VTDGPTGARMVSSASNAGRPGCRRAIKLRRRRAAVDPRSFDHFAASYDRRDELIGGWVTEWLNGVLTGRQGASAIDLGCGGGRLAVLLAEHYDKVRALDLSGEMIDLARVKRPHPRITYEQGDLTKVTGEYDLVLSVMALHHVPDLAATLDKVCELVTPGGLAILVDPAYPVAPPKGPWQYHWRNFVDFANDIRRAVEKYRLKSDRSWIEHLMSDRFLTPEEFVHAYSTALPGVVISPVRGLHTAVWERPA